MSEAEDAVRSFADWMREAHVDVPEVPPESDEEREALRAAIDEQMFRLDVLEAMLPVADDGAG